MAEAEAWKDGDGAWSCISCGIEPAGDNPEDKPLGHDFEPDEWTSEIPSNISPFWQERKYCLCCFEAWKEGFEEAVRMRACADCIAQMQKEAEPFAAEALAAPGSTSSTSSRTSSSSSINK